MIRLEQGSFSDWVDEDLAACCLGTTQKGLHQRLAADQRGHDSFVTSFRGRDMEAKYDGVFALRAGCLPPPRTRHLLGALSTPGVKQ